VCTALCKKVYKGHKVDYEPSSAVGLQLGVFDIDDFVEVIEETDSLGFDAIEIGNTVAWVMECVYKGLLPKEEVGIDKVPSFNPLKYSYPEDSRLNKEIAIKILKNIAYGETETCKVIGEGIRHACLTLDQKYKGVKDVALYVPYESGSITPCQYWDPAFLVPLPIQGKFLTKYHAKFMEPEEFAVQCVDRFVKELISEQLGFCRFHRGWLEKYADSIVEKILGKQVKCVEWNLNVMREIVEYNVRAGCKPVFWETSRTVDAFTSYVFEEAASGNEVAVRWREAIDRKGGVEAAKEYWERFLGKMEEILGVKSR